MNRFIIDDNKLYYDDKLIIDFDCSIKGIIEISNDCIILLLKYEYNSKVDNNVLRIDKYGKIIWRIESQEYPDGPSIVTSIRYADSELIVYRMIGVNEYISLDSGKVIKSVFVK